MIPDQMNILEAIDHAFKQGAKSLFGDAAAAMVSVVPARDTKHGDFQCSAALALAKSVGKPPPEVARALVEQVQPLLADLIEPLTTAGPGFINIRLKPAALAGALSAIDSPDLGVARPASPQTVVVDLCGVNLAKRMHVGHLRATVIGDALARIYERLGWNVIRQNHFGDWGLPIAMVTHEVKLRADAGKLDIKSLTLDQLEKLYKGAQKASDADERGLAAVLKYGLGPKAQAELEAQVGGATEALDAAKKALVALQSHDPAYVSVWREISRITLAACFDDCRRLGTNVTDAATAGESSYSDELASLVDDLVQRGLAVESDGALVIPLEADGIKEPLIIRKRGGGFLYATTDLAGIRRRVQKLGASRVVYAVDARQGFHFKQVFIGARKAGYARHASGEDAQLTHAAFGMVLGEDGTPFKTRSGENVKLSDLLDEAVERAERAVAEKNPALDAKERRSIAEAVGMGAIKYTDLSTERIKDYVFSFDRMIAFEGNTGPYLQYAVVRVKSIFRKAQEQFGLSEADAAAAPFAPAMPEEKAVALELLKYPGLLNSAAEGSYPHLLCGYLYTVAQAFSTFFAACPVLQAPDEQTRLSRLRLCSLTGRVLADGLRTLGITVLERM